jgi:hypothetical protein
MEREMVISRGITTCIKMIYMRTIIEICELVRVVAGGMD